MKKNGITRRIDDLGRIVIPKEIRKNLKIKNSEEVLISVEDNKVILSKFDNVEKDHTINTFVVNLSRYLKKNVLFTSRDKVIDYALNNKEILNHFELNQDITELLEKRKVISETGLIDILGNKDNYTYIVYPIIINGDLIGSVIIYTKEEIASFDYKILEFGIKFLELYLE